MKIISFAVPCYNSQDYMSKCIDSLLVGRDDVEIIIVNDGSKDDTSKIAHGYAEKYPALVRVIDKENGGHGSGVNAGLKAATGLYYKVVDSDDWLDADALKTLLETIKRHMAEGDAPDLYITNFVREKVADNTRYPVRYEKKFPVGEMFGWERVKNFHFSHVLMMHSLLYNREKLIESGTVLPEHTFYVDNVFAFKPLPYIHKLYYLDADLYRYYIGRADQSITWKNIVNRYKMHIRVMHELVDAYTWEELRAMPKGLKNYMWHLLNDIMIITVTFVCGGNTPERKADLKALWQYIKERDIKIYRKLRYRSYSSVINFLPWRLRGWVSELGYKVLCKRRKFG